MVNFPLPRIDIDTTLHDLLIPYCRIHKGEIWIDDQNKHKVGCIDSVNSDQVNKMMGNEYASLAIQDPPYNFVAFEEMKLSEFIRWCELWINITDKSLKDNAALYVWLGADQNNHFQPLSDFIRMMSKSGFNSRSFITMRNQRGYGTQKNWMSVRQELLYYVKGNPGFNIDAEYTEIPKILKGYYKIVDGKETENLERGKSANIRAGNVWVDIQQVFYRMEENVNGCYAQKPLKSIERIVLANSNENEIIIDLFAHSGTTLIAAEKLNRRCFTADIDPVYCEISIRRLENLRNNNKTGWQNSNPFADDIIHDKKILNYLKRNYDLDLSSIKSEKIAV
jgi:site-specific DNA-methyltransferase (adenine-specific)